MAARRTARVAAPDLPPVPRPAPGSLDSGAEWEGVTAGAGTVVEEGAHDVSIAETVWESKGVQRASTALELMFPMPLTSPEALARVNEWLHSSPANPAAKRYVAEGADDMARALRAQQRFA